uniref:Uncharacterized protein n=1 Tax=Chromera velia CCMP2878 TaxID=1169474 RepID=A0A0G4GKE0_9ALVE|eukprot:Cvel_4819.t1-p1 / transcript=Cvel_4819.t1 / gene=Cvel_4819 / organism=Chromera_velia_CCMP2878 / gene_product=hypothetical protein / transcript_product=hypothetical protein / location=Cvel_scaffold217:285-10031(+) / protein_length=1527 / sequence_SO=supercontig / SO=protein_coding / is_pseudo=false
MPADFLESNKQTNKQMCAMHAAGSCLFEREIMECEQKQMLGGTVVEECGKCETLPHWFGISRKLARPPPPQFEWGTSIQVSCNPQRFSLIDKRQNTASDSFELHCVDGKWIDRYGSEGFENFECAACVQVGKPELGIMEGQGKDAHYFASRLPVQLVVQSTERDVHRVAIKKGTNHLWGNSFEGTSKKLSEEDVFFVRNAAAEGRFLLEGRGTHKNKCLRSAKNKDFVSHTVVTCDKNDDRQTWDADLLVKYAMQITMKYARKDAKGQSFFWNSNGDALMAQRMQTWAWVTDGAAVNALQFGGNGYLSPLGYASAMGIRTPKTKEHTWRFNKNFNTAVVACPDGWVLQDVRTTNFWKEGSFFSAMQGTYNCAPLATVPACQVNTLSMGASQAPEHAPLWGAALIGKGITCEPDMVLKNFTVSVLGKTGVVSGAFSCCRTGTPSVSLQALPQLYVPKVELPPSVVGGFEAWEGEYCPYMRDGTGRLVFAQKSSWKHPRSPRSINQLLFDRNLAFWCLSGLNKCLPSASAHPALLPEQENVGGLTLLGNGNTRKTDLTVSLVGDFELQAPKDKEAGEFTKPKPKKPAKIPKPKLAELSEFNVEDEYAPYCRAGDDPTKGWPLVKDMVDLDPEQGTMKTEFGKQAATPDKEGNFMFDSEFKGPDGSSDNDTAIMKNPCGFTLYGGRKNTPEIKSKAFVQSQKLGKDRSGINFESVMNCFGNEDMRELTQHELQYKMDIGQRVLERFVGPVTDAVLCGTLGMMKPVAAPLGVGMEIDPGDICSAYLAVAIEGIAFGFDQMQEQMDLFGTKAGINDCNAANHAFAKVFCDLACITDAVRTGNRAILSRLEEVFEILQTNMILMMEYHATNTDNMLNYLADLMDWHGDRLLFYIKKFAKGGTSFLQRLKDCRDKNPNANTEGKEEKSHALSDCLFQSEAPGKLNAQADPLWDLFRQAVTEDRSDARRLPSSVPSLASRLMKMSKTEAQSLLSDVSLLSSSLQNAMDTHLRGAAKALHEAVAAVDKEKETEGEGDQRKSMEALIQAGQEVERLISEAGAGVKDHLSSRRGALEALLSGGVAAPPTDSSDLYLSPAVQERTPDEVGRSLADQVRRSSTELLNKLSVSSDRHDAWLALWESRLHQHTKRQEALVTPKKKGMANRFDLTLPADGGEGVSELSLESKENEVEEILAQVAGELSDARTAAFAYLKEAKRMSDIERESKQIVEEYLNCATGADGELTGDFDKLLPAWQRVVAARQETAASLISAFSAGTKALSRVRDALVIRSLLEKMTQVSLVHAVTDLEHALSHLSQHESGGSVDRLRGTSGVMSLWLDELQLKEQDGGAIKPACLLEKLQTTEGVASLRAAFTRDLVNNGPGELSALLRETVGLVVWLHSRMKREDVWGDLSLLQFHQQTARGETGGSSELHSIHKHNHEGEVASEEEGGEPSAVAFEERAVELRLRAPGQAEIEDAREAMSSLLQEAKQWHEGLAEAAREKDGGEGEAPSAFVQLVQRVQNAAKKVSSSAKLEACQ